MAVSTAMTATHYLAPNFSIADISVAALKGRLVGWPATYFNSATLDHLRLVLMVLMKAFGWPEGEIHIPRVFRLCFFPILSIHCVSFPTPMVVPSCLLNCELVLFVDGIVPSVIDCFVVAPSHHSHPLILHDIFIL